MDLYGDERAARPSDSACYQALLAIKAALNDDTLQDDACFQKIEEIVCIFEALGSNGGARHDFG
ncbi:MAG: hypothetical protein PHS97_03220 [Oscillospiraceae bacterium]|nr:hypothetical protein [Oscillospiraceae bacterium]